MKSLKQILIIRDNITSEEATELIKEASEELHALLESGEEELAYNICEEYFGLEPDYLMDLM